MGFRVRKSIRIAPGVRMTVTPRGMSVSAGVKGARVSVNSRGRVTQTVGIPGSGISYSKTSTVGARRGSGRAPASPARTARAAAPAPTSAPAAPTPGFFAPAWEKKLVKLGRNGATGPDLHAVGALAPEAARIAAVFEVLRVALPTKDSARAVALLNWLHDQNYDPGVDPFMVKYFPDLSVILTVTPGIRATLPLARDALALLLAELEQSAGNVDRAIDVVESADPTTIAAVSLAELYAEQNRWGDIVQLTDGLTNEDDPSTYLLTQRGVALREQGYFDAARESFKEALRARSRSNELRQVASIERGKTYLAEGKKAMARKDFERVLAENSEYEGLAELLIASQS
ncbi:MAG: hypothetical protein JWP57_4588 [Spirosoma sp.]|nr:hypothetical protein [Spirosoma sp.]